MGRTVTVSLGQHDEDQERISAFCSAADEGDNSPDVLDFDEELFINELKESWRIDSDSL